MSWLEKVYALFAQAPATLAPAYAPLAVSEPGWLIGEHVTIIKSRASWYDEHLKTTDSKPRAIVAHYTATDKGTALRMARTRADHDRSEFPDPPGSWHVSIEQNGDLIQQISFRSAAYHAGGTKAQPSKPIEPFGRANGCSVGIELVGFGKAFTQVQVEAACRLWRALVATYPITREHAMVEHSKLDPWRRRDPGPVWMTKHAPRVLDYAYGVG